MNVTCTADKSLPPTVRQTAATLREALSTAFDRAGHAVAKQIHRGRRHAVVRPAA